MLEGMEKVLGARKWSSVCEWAGEQKPVAWAERWRGSLSDGESRTRLRFRAEKREERLQV